MQFLMNKQVFIQVWAEQKHPDPNKEISKMTTREYFEMEALNAQANMAGKLREKVAFV